MWGGGNRNGPCNGKVPGMGDRLREWGVERAMGEKGHEQKKWICLVFTLRKVR